MGLPSKTKVQAYTPEHITDSVPYWRTSQDNWDAITGRNVSLLATSGWEGNAGEAALAHVQRAHLAGVAAQEVGLAAMGTAELHVSTLWFLKQTATDAITAAEADGFEVSEGYGIKDRTQVPAQLAAARQAQAQTHQQTIVAAVQALQAHDTEVGAVLRGHRQALQGVTMMSGGGFKQDPLISNPQEPDKPNPIVGPPPSQSVPDTSKKSGPRQAFDGMTEVVGGALLDLAGTAALVPEVIAEVPTAGLDTPLTAASIGGLLTGSGMIEDGLDDLNHLGGLAK